MPLELWLAFVAASSVLLAVPGPTIMLVVSYAVGARQAIRLGDRAGRGLSATSPR